MEVSLTTRTTRVLCMLTQHFTMFLLFIISFLVLNFSSLNGISEKLRSSFAKSQRKPGTGGTENNGI